MECLAITSEGEARGRIYQQMHNNIASAAASSKGGKGGIDKGILAQAWGRQCCIQVSCWILLLLLATEVRTDG